MALDVGRYLHVVPQHGSGCGTELLFQHRGPGHDAGGHRYPEQLDRRPSLISFPFGKGQTSLEEFLNKVLDIALGGWSIQGTQLIHSGSPLSVSQTNGNNGCGCGQNPNATGVSAVRPLIGHRSDTGVAEPGCVFHCAGLHFRERGAEAQCIRTGRIRSGRLNVQIVYGQVKYYKFQFRIESLNLTNTVLFANPSTNISTPGTFGTITSQSNFPRLDPDGGAHYVLICSGKPQRGPVRCRVFRWFVVGET